ncbi:MAG: 2OG-Fe dioxygenase family protein [Burkholderiales bacterium]|nr:2OG-Fe dioxygenase family protein [Burkholderiales bacterium]
MPQANCRPPLTPCDAVQATLRDQGFAVVGTDDTCQLLGLTAVQLAELEPFWADLPPDEFLKDGGRYRKRRHGSFVVDGATVRQVPHRAHWQPLAYNALHGGMARWFGELSPECVASGGWLPLLQALGTLASDLKGPQAWFTEAHMFRIDTAGGIGRPTPEGAHRDGVDFVAVFMVGRHGIKGGESRVFEANGPKGQRFTLTQPWSLLLLDDEKVIHESTPIQPALADELGWRDTLVITLRSGGFQDDTLTV